MFRQERHERSRPRGRVTLPRDTPFPLDPPGPSTVKLCNVSVPNLPHLKTVRSDDKAVRVGYIGEGACNCGSNFSAPPLCRILWVLSWRSKKVPPPAGKIKNRLKKSLRRANFTRGTTQIAAYAAPSRSNKRYPLTRADGRTYCAGGSALRLGRDGYLERDLLAHTCRQLSEKPHFLTVFVKAFAILNAFYHVPAEKSNVFAGGPKYFYHRAKNR